VLLVSHNMAAVAELADRALLLDAGSVVVDGSVAEAVSTYLAKGTRKATYIRPLIPGISSPHIARAEIVTSDPNAVHHFGKSLEIKFWIRHPTPMIHGSFCFQIYNSQFQLPIIHSSYYDGTAFGDRPGCSVIVCRFPRVLLNVGQFHLCTYLQDQASRETYEYLEGICAFEVIRVNDTQIAG
jgi:hypothetical protein